jgi:Transposase IS4
MVGVGVQCSENSINSPLKAWRQVFTNSIITKMVKHTNIYGAAKAKDWCNITNTDLTDFFSVLFIASVQKRKDRTSNWWCDHPLLENVTVKKVMSGRWFHSILWFLHVCDLDKQPSWSDPSHDPSYKVNELLEGLQDLFSWLFVPGRNLSLDDNKIRSLLCFIVEIAA